MRGLPAIAICLSILAASAAQAQETHTLKLNLPDHFRLKTSQTIQYPDAKAEDTSVITASPDKDPVGAQHVVTKQGLIFDFETTADRKADGYKMTRTWIDARMALGPDESDLLFQNYYRLLAALGRQPVVTFFTDNAFHVTAIEDAAAIQAGFRKSELIRTFEPDYDLAAMTRFLDISAVMPDGVPYATIYDRPLELNKAVQLPAETLQHFGKKEVVPAVVLVSWDETKRRAVFALAKYADGAFDPAMVVSCAMTADIDTGLILHAVCNDNVKSEYHPLHVETDQALIP